MTATITMNNLKNGIEIAFDGKPESSVIANLKANGFRWSSKQKFWYAKQTEERLSFAESIGKILTCESKHTKSDNIDLWAITRTDDIENNFEKYHIYETKKIASIIRKHLRDRFSFCKWSVTSESNSIYVKLLVSPFAYDSDELKAIAHYAYKFAESYNYDNSDAMTDYFDVNFYGVYESSIVSRYNYEQREITEAEKEMVKNFEKSKEEFDIAEKLRQQKEYEEALKKREAERLEYEKLNQIRNSNVQKIENNHRVVMVDYTITNALLKANKDDNLDDTTYFDERQTRTSCQVCKEVYLDKNTYNLFERQLMDSYSFLEGLGGTKTDDRRIQSQQDFNMMSREERESVEWYNYDCVAIYCDNELKLIIDPQGYDYARYVYVIDEQSEKVGEYHSNYGIDAEDYKRNVELAETIEDVSTDIITNAGIIETWNNKDFDLYKTLMKNWIKTHSFKFNIGIVRAIKLINLKEAMYRILTEVDSFAGQISSLDLEVGQKLTIIQINDFGMLSTSRVKFVGYEVGDYAQYKNATKLIFRPENKRNDYYRWFYRDAIIYNGWFEIPQSVLFDEIDNGNGIICRESKFLSYDNKQYDAIMEYFSSRDIKPIINTYKPDFR